MMAHDRRWQAHLDWLLLLPLVFVPRLLGLDLFLTPDEPWILDQVREFAAGLAGGDFGRTMGVGYMGVTLSWWSALPVSQAPTEWAAYTGGRTATALATGLLLLALYYLARRLMGRWPALLGVGLLALDPYTLGYSRLLHMAAPLALFMSLAGVSYWLWLDRGRYGWLWLTGLFTGLALLTKPTALLLGPMLVTGGAAWGLFTYRRRARWWLRQGGGLAVVALAAGVGFFALWPAMWSSPGQALQVAFGRLLVEQEAGVGNMGMFWRGRFVQDPGPAFYPVAFLLKATPWLLVGLLFSLCLALPRCWLAARRLPLRANLRYGERGLVISLWLFALVYVAIMSAASKKSVRYLLPAFPTLYLLAGLAFYQAAATVKDWQITGFRSRSFRPGLGRLLLAGGGLALVGFSWLYHPYYFSYYNPLLGGWRWGPETILVGWGEGLDRAAGYLDQQPPAEVAAWYPWLWPLYYEPGRIEPVVPIDNLLTAGWSVFYINQVQRDIPDPNLVRYFQERRLPAHTVRLNGIDYAWVYPGPVAGFRPDPTPQYPLGGDFGGEARLLGYDLHPQPRSGAPLVVTLYWRALAVPPAERFVYVRLVDERGHVWAGTDSPPVMGFWPTTRWQPEMLIEDAHRLDILPGTPPGPYRLEVGLYDPASGQPLPAAGQPMGRGGGLLLGEVSPAWQPLRAKAELPHQADVRLADSVRLVGYSTLPDAAVSGDLLPLSLAWREAGPRWGGHGRPALRFEWRQAGQEEALAHQADSFPLPPGEWGRRALLRTQHELVVPPTLADGLYQVVLRLVGDGAAGETIAPLGQVAVESPPHRFELPPEVLSPAGAAHLEEGISLVGYQLERGGAWLEVSLYWQAQAPVSRRYKVFVQLLGAEGSLLAQSDSFPAGGERPTTGWLPGEIITDGHTLALPADLPAGTYRLIVGLYDPMTGQRLSAPGGEGDAITVTEVRLP